MTDLVSYKIFYPKDIHSPGAMACGKLRSLSLTTIHCSITVCRCWKPILAQNLYREHKESTAFLDGLRVAAVHYVPTQTSAIFIFFLPFCQPPFTAALLLLCIFQGIKLFLPPRTLQGPPKRTPLPQTCLRVSHLSV